MGKFHIIFLNTLPPEKHAITQSLIELGLITLPNFGDHGDNFTVDIGTLGASCTARLLNFLMNIGEIEDYDSRHSQGSTGVPHDMITVTVTYWGGH